MGVHFSISTTSASNKPGKVLLAQSEIAYQMVIGKKDRLYVLKPKIDKLSIAFDVPLEEDRKGIVSMLISSIKNDDLPWITNAPSTNKTGRYNIEAILKPPGVHQSVLIQAKPKAKAAQVAFMRFEFNPHKLGKEGFQFFKMELAAISAGNFTYADIAKHGKTTRMDLACDLVNARVSELVVTTSKQGKSHAYYGVASELETIYLALKKGKASDIVVYNKAQQLADSERHPKYGAIPHTRVEVRVRPNRPPSKLLELKKNPLAQIQVYGIGVATPPETHHHWLLFLDSCRHRGVAGALDLLPTELRHKYGAVLEASLQQHWRPDKIWACLPEVLAQSGLLE